jgi:hypothetical protein
MKTTLKHYNYFCGRVSFYKKKFHLDEWEVDTDFVELRNELAVAQTGRHEHGGALISLSKSAGSEYDSEQEMKVQLDLNAKHEILHLLLGDLAMKAYDRCVSEKEINISEERLVRRLSKFL